ncbi:ATP-binding protein [Minwuia thermotolerans]|uniref:ATP-binding protein n=1 Tax=Minwuia thermotolerans TaxID=2056226 RepID=UPI0019D26EE1|nr:ATP-binding protein [Minwuia thermotolerans]
MVGLRGFIPRQPDAGAVTRRSPDRDEEAGPGPAAHNSIIAAPKSMNASFPREVQSLELRIERFENSTSVVIVIVANHQSDAPTGRTSFAGSSLDWLYRCSVPSRGCSVSDPISGSSPASTGAAGQVFESQVAAHYLLSMLADTEARGLPGFTIDSVELQRAGEGYALDDVIVRGSNDVGQSAVLEIQAKRDIRFTADDSGFAKVVRQILKSASRQGFWESADQLSVAISRGPHKVTGAFQDVLKWARSLESAEVFFERLGRPGVANDDMRGFATALKSQLEAAGDYADDRTVWQFLRRLTILVFDFGSEGSASEELSIERAVRVLQGGNEREARKLWDTLQAIASDGATTARALDRAALVDQLAQRNYKLSASSTYRSIRGRLAEDAEHGLGDIDDEIRGIVLGRCTRLSAVREAQSESRYVEIRGEGGVGKSAILKHLAEAQKSEARILFLNPERVVKGGWAAWRGQLGFPDTLRDLLADLALDGAATIFIDGLDRFTEPEARATVRDLIDEAAKVTGVSVIVTARSDFDRDEPNWLPENALQRLGANRIVVDDQLDSAEIEEVRTLLPDLAPLLFHSHPAYNVALNLFRLKRLARQQSAQHHSATEAAMSRDWWQSAGGIDRDPLWRSRGRVLRALATAALGSSGPYDLSDQDPAAIDALVRSETLTDHGSDRLSFRHDVFEEWAVANYLLDQPEEFNRLTLAEPVPVQIDRSLEIHAQLLLERADGEELYRRLLQKMRESEAHPSWRRSLLLALAHYESGTDLLDRMEALLLADEGGLLIRLISIVRAVDSVSVQESYRRAGIEIPEMPSDVFVAANASWHRLVRWSLNNTEKLPPPSIRHVADLMIYWSLSSAGEDRITPMIAKQLHAWLMHIEECDETLWDRSRREAFDGEIGRDDLSTLERILRTGFLNLCHRTPELAHDYLDWLTGRRHGTEISSGILRDGGGLARAAPDRFVDFILHVLTPDRRYQDFEMDPLGREPFEDHGVVLIPASPAKGPFRELLKQAPEEGLRLIREIVARAITFYFGENDFGDDAFSIQWVGTERLFPRRSTYNWSRESSASPPAVACALMALEEWGHQRIESGDAVEDVLADVLGAEEPSAAFLLVAVDLVLSHRALSMQAAIPLLGSPELLCWDLHRQVYDRQDPMPDILSIGFIFDQDDGAPAARALAARASRGMPLHQMIGLLALKANPQHISEVRRLLEAASERAGQPKPEHNLGDPAFMAQHALNLLDRQNWQAVTHRLQDGTPREGVEYRSPPEEEAHFQRLEELNPTRLPEIQMQMALTRALDNGSGLTEASATDAAKWLDGQIPDSVGNNDDTDQIYHARLAAALLIQRHGAHELRTEKASLCRTWFADAIARSEDLVHRRQPGLAWNKVAIAFTGYALLHGHFRSVEDRDALLRIAVRSDAAGAQGLVAARSALHEADPRLVQAIVRCAFEAALRPRRTGQGSQSELARRERDYQWRLERRISSEHAWLDGGEVEPPWPGFPKFPARPKSRLYIGPDRARGEAVSSDSRPQLHLIDHQGAAAWLAASMSPTHEFCDGWLRDILNTYTDWTCIALGSELTGHAEPRSNLYEWNDAFFRSTARVLPALRADELDVCIFDPIRSLPESTRFEAIAVLLRETDQLYFEHKAVSSEKSANIRERLSALIRETNGWAALRRNDRPSIENHLGKAVATLFFCDDPRFGQPRCYLRGAAIDQIASFLSVLSQCVADAPTPMLAEFTLNLLEVSTRHEHLEFTLRVSTEFVTAHASDTKFWSSLGYGARFVKLLEFQAFSVGVALDLDQKIAIRRVLSQLIESGVPEAAILDNQLIS